MSDNECQGKELIFLSGYTYDMNNKLNAFVLLLEKVIFSLYF
jgi:hypothetical protein